MVSGWVIGAASAALAVRWVSFPEAFCRGSHDGGYTSLRSLHSLQQNGALALMMGSKPRDGSGDDSSQRGSDNDRVAGMEQGGGVALVSGDVP